MFEEDVIGLVVVLGLITVGVLLVLIVKELLDRRKPETIDEIVASGGDQTPAQEMEDEVDMEDVEPPGTKPRQETEGQRLTRVEKELAERERRVKSEKMRELDERERLIKSREEEIRAEPRKTPPEAKEREGLLAERGRIEELIRKAEDRYYAGELEEKNFKRIVSDYQKQLIDIDVKLKGSGRGHGRPPQSFTRL